MKYHIQYFENDYCTHERFASDNFDLILSWFADSVLHHTGSEACEEAMRLLKDTGGVCILSGDVEHEWVIG